MIFGCTRAKFSLHAVFGLHGTFRNVITRITENYLFSVIVVLDFQFEFDIELIAKYTNLGFAGRSL